MKDIINKNIYRLLRILILTGILADIFKSRFITPFILIGGISFAIIQLMYRLYMMKNNYNIFNDVKKNRLVAASGKAVVKEESEGNKVAPSHLNDNDMSLFSKEMKNVRKSIKSIEQAMDESDAISNIMSKGDRLKAIQLFHESLIQSPDRLTDASSFAYVNLPNLAKLVKMHVAFENEEIKNVSLVEAIESSKETIKNLSDLIVENYTDYKDKELKGFANHIDIVNKTIAKQTQEVG